VSSSAGAKSRWVVASQHCTPVSSSTKDHPFLPDFTNVTTCPLENERSCGVRCVKSAVMCLERISLVSPFAFYPAVQFCSVSGFWCVRFGENPKINSRDKKIVHEFRLKFRGKLKQMVWVCDSDIRNIFEVLRFE